MNSRNLSNCGQYTFIVKIQGDCNLNCSYCFYHNSSNQDHLKEMDFDLIKDLLLELSNYSTHHEIIWHGGEPLLGTKILFERIIELEKKLEKKKGVYFSNNIQTNGTLIDNDWINLFKDGDFKIGISIDGPEQIHDFHRKTRSGGGSFLETMHGIDLLKRNDIDFGCLSVITKYSLNNYNEILDFFISNELFRLDFLPYFEKALFNNTLMDGSLEPLDFSRFLINIFNILVERNKPDLKIRYISEIMKGLRGSKPTLCKFSNGCSKIVVINYDGAVTGCDKFPGIKAKIWGNLKDSELSDILSNKKHNSFISQVTKIHQECSECEYLDLCKGGCRKYSYMWNNNFGDKNYFCDDRKKLFSYLGNFLNTKKHLRPDSPFHSKDIFIPKTNVWERDLILSSSRNYPGHSDSWGDHWSDHHR